MNEHETSEHLTAAQLSALADGEIGGEELRAAQSHIDDCLPCARRAVDAWLMKPAVGKAGNRFEAPSEFRERIAKLVWRHLPPEAILEALQPSAPRLHWNATRRLPLRSRWALAAALVVGVSASVFTYRSLSSPSSEGDALANEACDLHIATLAAGQAPQVVSSDRHTVKPWFQGKLPFSFNLPEALPLDTVLDGANLVYLSDHPAAQLLFSIGHHHVSVFVDESHGVAMRHGRATRAFKAAHEGFNEDGFESGDLEMIAVSDVDPARLSALIDSLQAVQGAQ